MKTPKPKRPNVKLPVRPVKPGLGTVKESMPKKSNQPINGKSPMPKQLTGDAAIKAYQREVSPRGVKQKSLADKKAIDKKYPGLYKSATPKPKKK